MIRADSHVTFFLPEGEYYSSSPVIWKDFIDPHKVDSVRGQRAIISPPDLGISAVISQMWGATVVNFFG